MVAMIGLMSDVEGRSRHRIVIMICRSDPTSSGCAHNLPHRNLTSDEKANRIGHRIRLSNHSALILSLRMTLAHFLVSAATKFAN
jgi:hypothetical protein